MKNDSGDVRVTMQSSMIPPFMLVITERVAARDKTFRLRF